MNSTLQGVARDHVVTEENKNEIVHFAYSEKAAKQFGYHSAILKNGEKINFTCQGKQKDSNYKWEDKVEFEPIKKSDIAQWQHDNFHTLESKINVMNQRRMEQEMSNHAYSGSHTYPKYK
jgi:hypothetical protein